MAAHSPTGRLTRRHFLAGIGGAAAAATMADARLLAAPARSALAGPAQDGDVFDALRFVWSDILTGGAFDPADPMFADALGRLDDEVQRLTGEIVREPDRDHVFVGYPFTDPGGDVNLETTCRQLRVMARGYATVGSRWQGHADLLADVLAGLETTNVQIYHVGQPGFGNWWNWQVGAPKPFLATCTLVYDQLDPEVLTRYLAAIDHFDPDPRRIIYLRYGDPDAYSIVGTGSNRVSMCEIALVRGILGLSETRVIDARQALIEPDGKVFTHATDEGGFYADGSFIAHGNVPYTGGYGVDLLESAGKLFALLAGSPWAITEPGTEVLFDAVERSYRPVIYDAQMMSAVRGRNISRNWDHEHRAGHRVILGVLRLAHAVESDTATRWRGLCRGWVERDTYDSLVDGATLPDVALVKEMLDDSIAPAQEPVGFALFPNMARAVHRGAGWAYTIAMASKRIAYYEVGNNENFYGFHTADGMTYLYNADNSQYTDDFWPTVDAYRLPGITVDKKPLPPGAGGTWGAAHPEHATWVGGTSLEGVYGAVGMELEALDSPLRAQKSWFCLDELVVALGAGIIGSSGYPVETIVENRSLHADGDSSLLVNGIEQPTTQGWSASLSGVRWAHLDGVGGYVFPRGADLQALREERTGRWRDINGAGPTDDRTRRYLTMWIDHGTDPSDGSYAYMFIPGATPHRTAALASNPGLYVLVNNTSVQAVQVPRLGITALNYWTPDSIRGITATAPCSLLMRRHGRELTIAIADPTHEQDAVTITLRQPGYHSWIGDDTITVHTVHWEISFTVDTRDAQGATHTVTFRQ